MSEENNFLTSSNGVYIEITSNNKEHPFENLLNPDRDVRIKMLDNIHILISIVNVVIK